jgi:DNA repair exonuclease SbcCD ATPase subunit
MIPHLLTAFQRGYISWLTERSAKVEERIDNAHTLEDYLENEKESKTKFLTQQDKHEQELKTLQAEINTIEQDEQDNIAVRNSLLPIIKRRGSDCAGEWRAALDRCNRSLELIEARKTEVNYQISARKETFRQELEGYDTRIKEYGEQIEAYALELAQEERKKRAIHIMKKLVAMGESGMATWSDRELDYLEKWVRRLAVRKPIGDSD